MFLLYISMWIVICGYFQIKPVNVPVLLIKMFSSLIFVFVSSLTFVVIGAEYIASSPSQNQDANYCILPPYPENGRYTVSNNPSATPGERYSSVRLIISCDTGYINNSTVKRILCINGDWSASMPTCDRDLKDYCTLPTGDLKVEYRCLSFTVERSWECESLVSAATLVKPICRSPAYFSLKVLPEMHCRDGMWDYNPICQPACGLTTQHRQLEGNPGNHLELPWHAVIYEKSSESYKKKCGGSLISATKIISVAQCFCDSNDKLLPASNFVVTVNKMYQPYNDSRDMNRQHSNVVDIKIPSGYRGYAKYYEDDIAIAVIERPLFFHLSVRPICLDFDDNLDKAQLTEGNSGITVHWTTAGNEDVSSEVQNVVDFQYIKREDCNNKLWIKHRLYLTNDKFCAGYIGAIWPSTRDVGGGLAFLEPTTQRYYLRGVLSVGYLGALDNTIVNIHTSILKHQNFIKQHL